ncbi:proton-coupled amino acid transporter-like protein pathetic isoform X2 [Leguminivora glycinivorella]|uniref:proton-coupled amino acid transporter-like protein pathetic isoform X2 n=1 Tax=Leguminivora glycinivorella TaxID=1035111 RepID=UPI00200CB72A|nr:proton-coupled amino acid transporter-like protein pathetic isoform X2 [Leguminivora glycinivorella]
MGDSKDKHVSVEANKPAPRPQRQELTLKATGQEARNYDYTAARIQAGQTKNTNFLETVGNFVKSCLGGGVVGIHAGYKKCGLISGLIINVLAGFMLAHSKMILVSSAQLMYGRLQVPSLTYPELAEASLKTGPFPKLAKYGTVFRYMVDATICINLFGSCCVYSVIIARTIKQLLELGNVVAEANLRIYIACMLIPLVLIAMILNLKYLAPFSIVANILLILLAFSTIYFGSKAATKSPTEFPLIKDAEGFFEFLGICIFSMEGMGMVIPIENYMKKPKDFPKVLCVGMSAVISVVVTIGFFGYWGYGEQALTPITMNFPWEPYPIILKSSLALVLYVTFGLNIWAPFNLVWVYIKVRHNPDRLWFTERVYRALIVLALILLAIAFPNINAFMGFLGSFALGLSGFMYPAVIDIIVKWHDPGLGCNKWRLGKFFLVFFFGLFLCFLGGYSNLKNLLMSSG